MKYQVLEAAEARRYLQGCRAKVAFVREPSLEWRGEGEEFDVSFISTLRTALTTLQSRYSEKRSDNDNSEFEAEASVLVHSAIPSEPRVLADFGFWTWLAVLHFPQTVEWRYGQPEGGVDLKNYGIGAKNENLLYRLWLRGEISLDESAAHRYHLTRKGQVDFWRSHLFRQGYASVPAMARALIGFQYPDDLDGKPRLKISEIRALAPRMKRLRANLMYEFLDEAACLKLVQREAAQVGTT